MLHYMTARKIKSPQAVNSSDLWKLNSSKHISNREGKLLTGSGVREKGRLGVLHFELANQGQLHQIIQMLEILTKCLFHISTQYIVEAKLVWVLPTASTKASKTEYTGVHCLNTMKQRCMFWT